ncbi:MAG: tetratricopeptide repeat protein [Terriglobales bacterium]
MAIVTEPAAGERWATSDLVLRMALVLAAAAYARAVTFDFVFDDHLQIALNPWIQAWRFVPHYFTGHVWSFEQPAWAGNYYRPLFLLWLRVVNSIVGLTPGWWHLLTIAAHLLATWMVYRLGVKLLRSQLAAALAALLFGVNPIHVEAVAWVSGIPEILLAIFCMASLLAYLNWREHRRKTPIFAKSGQMWGTSTWWMAASAVGYLLAMLVKETGVVLVVIIAVHALLFDEEKSSGASALQRARNAIRLLLPYAAVALAYFAARWTVLRGVVSPLHHRPLATVWLSWPKLLAFYLRQLVWPFGLSAYYDVELVKGISFHEVILPALLVAWIVALYAVIFRRSKLMLLAGVAMLAPILPAVYGAVVFQTGDFVHDRYLYLPSVALALALGGAIARAQVPQRMQVGIGLVAAVALAVSTAVQSAPWDNDMALFTHARQHAPHNVRAMEGQAEAYGILGDMEGALRVQREVTEEQPNYWAGVCNRGLYYYRAGRYPEAEQALLHAIDHWPAGSKPMSANQFYFLGMSRLQMHRPQDAEAPLRRAVELRPDAAGYHYALGVVLRQQGNQAEAAAEFRAEAVNRKRIDEQMKALGLDVVQ